MTPPAVRTCKAGVLPVDAPPLLFFRFSGSGWLLSFHCGAGKFIQDHLDSTSEQLRFGGESGGSLVAAALALGMDVDSVYEASLDLYDKCKSNPFKMGAGIAKALSKLSPDDSTWAAASGRLVVGVSTIEHRHGVKFGWKPTHVSTFRSRQHGTLALRASCHLPVMGGILGLKLDGAASPRCFDGGMAESFPEVPPAVLLQRPGRGAATKGGRAAEAGDAAAAAAAAGAAAAAAAAAAQQIFHLDVCAWGNEHEGFDICPGFAVPIGWFIFPSTPAILRKLFRLGYLRAMELFCRISPHVTHNLWRRSTASSSAAVTSAASGLTTAMSTPHGAHGDAGGTAASSWRRRSQGNGSPAMAAPAEEPEAPLPAPSPFGLEQLADVRRQIEVLLRDLEQADLSGCTNCLLGLRKDSSPLMAAASTARRGSVIPSGMLPPDDDDDDDDDFVVPKETAAAMWPPSSSGGGGVGASGSIGRAGSSSGGGAGGNSRAGPRVWMSGAALGMVAKQYKRTAAARAESCGLESALSSRVPVQDENSNWMLSSMSVVSPSAAPSPCKPAAAAAAAASASAFGRAADAAAYVHALSAAAAASAPLPASATHGGDRRRSSDAAAAEQGAEAPPRKQFERRVIAGGRSMPSFVQLRQYQSFMSTLPHSPAPPASASELRLPLPLPLPVRTSCPHLGPHVSPFSVGNASPSPFGLRCSTGRSEVADADVIIAGWGPMSLSPMRGTRMLSTRLSSSLNGSFSSAYVGALGGGPPYAAAGGHTGPASFTVGKSARL